MATQTISSPNLSLRAKLILTGVIPALVPWAPLILSSHLPDILLRFFLLSKGWVAWTLIEYSLHRWVYHGTVQKKSRENDPFNHHYHHTHPDSWIFNHLHRSISLAAMVLCVFTLFAGAVWLCYPAGMVLGFTLYISVHWFLHQQMAIKAFPRLVKHHIWHHCKYPNKCFGVTSIFWDRLFKSLPPEYKAMPDSIIQFYFKHEGLDESEIARVSKLMNREDNKRQTSSSHGMRA